MVRSIGYNSEFRLDFKSKAFIRGYAGNPAQSLPSIQKIRLDRLTFSKNPTPTNFMTISTEVLRNIMKKKIYNHLIFIICLSLLLQIFTACQKRDVELQGAVITALKGSVRITNNQNKSWSITSKALYSDKALLLPGYTIETGKNSSADLEFTIGVMMRIAPSSKLKLETAQLLAEKDYTRIQMKIERGKVFHRSRKLNPGSNITVRTPTAIAAVRGTEFLVKVTGSRNTILVKSGTVVVADSNLTKSEKVEEDKKAEISDNGTITVSKQDEKDKSELAQMSSNIAGITRAGKVQMRSILQSFAEQKELIRQSYEDQKRINEKVMSDQKAKNREVIEGQKNRDLELMRNQQKRNRELISGVKNVSEQARDEVLDKSKKEKDKIQKGGKKDVDRIKKTSPIKSQDKTMSELEKLKKIK